MQAHKHKYNVFGTSTMEYDVLLDYSGLSCPQPVLELTKVMRKMKKDTVVCVISTDRACESNIPIFVRRHKYELLGAEKERKEGKYVFFIRKPW